jgi:hypothetical protein
VGLAAAVGLAGQVEVATLATVAVAVAPELEPELVPEPVVGSAAAPSGPAESSMPMSYPEPAAFPQFGEITANPPGRA